MAMTLVRRYMRPNLDISSCCVKYHGIAIMLMPWLTPDMKLAKNNSNMDLLFFKDADGYYKAKKGDKAKPLLVHLLR
jgi:hypothetical protein